MARIIHFRLYGLRPERHERLVHQVEAMAVDRAWRSDPLWMATPLSKGLFESEYLRHLQANEGPGLVAGGFLKMAGDETDAFVLLFFLRDLSAEYGIRAAWRDEENPLHKLRYLEFRGGLLPSGGTLEDYMAKRPIIKKVGGTAIQFYPPSYQVHSGAPQLGHWGYSLQGLRAYAPSLFEAEQEALKIARGLRHLGP